jgi:hypothetical protein
VSSNTAWSFLLISRDRSKVIVPSVWWELYTDPIMLCFLAICAWEDKTNKILLYSVDYLICQQGGLVGQMVPQKMNANFINADKPTVKNCRLLLQMFLKTASIYSKHSTVLINFFNITIPLNLKYMWCFSSQLSKPIYFATDSNHNWKKRHCYSNNLYVLPVHVNRGITLEPYKA